MADSLEYAFEPQTIKLHDEDFVVELEPTCERRYDDCGPAGCEMPDSDDYGPQCWDALFERWTYEKEISTAPQAEYVVRYISWDRTVMVALSGGQFAKVPSKIAVTSTAVGYHLDGAVLIVDGRAVKARGARICETTAEDKRAIEKERGALGVLAADRAAAAGRNALDAPVVLPEVAVVEKPVVALPAARSAMTCAKLLNTGVPAAISDFDKLPVAVVKTRWRLIELPGEGKRTLDLHRRVKRQEALKAIWDHCRARGDPVFDWGYIRQELNMTKGKEYIKCDRLVHDLFRNQGEDLKSLLQAVGSATDEKYRLLARFEER